MTPRFSIVIPTYNRATSVSHTLSGCFAQTFENFEIIVVDDGSSDNTLEVLDTIQDSRLVVVSQKNAGPAAARNAGMDAACGEYIAFLDSDDVWYPDYLAAANQSLTEKGEVALYGQLIIAPLVPKNQSTITCTSTAALSRLVPSSCPLP